MTRKGQCDILRCKWCFYHLIRQPASGCHREIALAIVPSGFPFEGKA
ncbi:MAG: hypothetical protein J6B71_10575 [Clostridia bacterium]|nr:hypothetical protein [Clostridia bacterium]